MIKPAPYIGICDFSNAVQIQVMATLLDAQLERSSPRLLMAGVMMSRVTLLGSEASKWSKVWPAKEWLASIFISHHRVLNTLHYADRLPDEDLILRLAQAAGWCGPNLNALQLDITWPDPKVIHLFRDTRPDLKLILQINRQSLKQENFDPERVAERLAQYAPSVDYALFDQSMGRGQPLDPEVAPYFLRAIRTRLPDMGLAVAGGLGPDRLDVLRPIIAEFPDISIDACSRLRPSHDAVDPIDWGLATIYLDQAIALLPN